MTYTELNNILDKLKAHCKKKRYKVDLYGTFCDKNDKLIVDWKTDYGRVKNEN